ncbi:Protein phosphatase PP2A regulatory subunit B [Thelotrema lepadinum]|nr:Protein phosphatase PP2A regulatory subunit B [Thelotrema lepadinum]
MPNLGTHSIIGLIDSDTIKLNYNVGYETIDVVKGKDVVEVARLDGIVFSYLKTFMKQRRVQGGTADLPFWGGLMGYITYEACLETIEVPSRQQRKEPDIGLACVERSIVIDHTTSSVHIQSIRPNDFDWVRKTQDSLLVDHRLSPGNEVLQADAVLHPQRNLPLESTYKPKISSCQEEIRAGNSYELCLTNQAMIPTNSLSKSSSWARYLKLRKLNPAPFAAYVRLGPLTVLSTSPERFLSWTRPNLETNETINVAGDGLLTSTCQFRPIKGTVKKRQVTATGETRLVDLNEATTLLSTPKERAENLMIVDLIRHDLSGVVGSGNARVSSLMSVEEYESVYQLVSVIEGNLKTPSIGSHDACYARSTPSGIDVLAASLPPGSMTGAPKKRSCEILQSIENEPRSIYSGVLGYMCVGGGGDFSVVIRTVYKWDDDGTGDMDEWKIGAGGAITALSNEDDEWEEMLTKLKSTLGLFGI